ncbi:MAG: electron transport complex subunit E [Buchnera aphidicola (Chaetogeoica yunlongensis)]
MNKFFKIILNGFWKKNSSLVQLLGLCPVLSVTTSVVNAIGLGIATTIVLIITNVIISSLKKYIPRNIRIPIYIIVISSIVSSLDLLIKAYFYYLYHSLGIFIPLIITNCIVCSRADSVAIKSSIFSSFIDGLSIGLGATWSMFLLGMFREIFGHGTLFFGIEDILGYCSHYFNIKIFHVNSIFLFFLFPSGAFLILAFIIAGKNYIETRLSCINYKRICLCMNNLVLNKNKINKREL